MINLDYQEPTKTEDAFIRHYFGDYLRDNDIDHSGWSQPEMDFHLDIFRTGWMLCQNLISKL